MNALLRSPLVMGSCSAALLIIATALTLGASPSTPVILVTLAAALSVTIAALGYRPPAPSVVPIPNTFPKKNDKS